VRRHHDKAIKNDLKSLKNPSDFVFLAKLNSNDIELYAFLVFDV